MKRPNPLLLLCAMACCLVLAQKASAQNVYVDSYVSLLPDQGWVVGSVQVYASYDVGWNYSIAINADLSSEDGSQWAYNSWYGTLYSTAWVNVIVDMYADTEYTVNGEYYLYAYYNYDYYNYYDAYNFWHWIDQYINGYRSFNFFGPGPPTLLSQSNVRLGRTHENKRVGRPHHLKVVSDTGQSRTNACESIVRTVVWRVVDVNDRGVGVVRIKEVTDPSNQVSSCEGASINITQCGYNGGGANSTINDRISVGCPGTLTPETADNCGWNNTTRWQWCPSGRAPVTLATIPYSVRFSEVLLGGYAFLPVNTNIYE